MDKLVAKSRLRRENGKLVGIEAQSIPVVTPNAECFDSALSNRFY